MSGRFNILIFKLEATDGRARTGSIHTTKGTIDTPVFMPVGTQASVKSLDPKDLTALNAQIILGNTYHLYLRPGVELIKDFGGLGKFMGWDGPILTDSGGFQGFSLGRLMKTDQDGIEFKSHLDGSSHLFTPEKVIDYQESLGSDIVMPLDWCVELPNDLDTLKMAVKRTTSWAERSLNVKSNDQYALFGIVQGGTEKTLRELSAKQITKLDFDGYSIGGLSVGETKSKMYDIASFTAQLLPENKPRYLMGVGSPEDLFESVAVGIDMFDCVLPTRVARNGSLFTSNGRINIVGKRFRAMNRPIEAECDCYTCMNFTASYLSHLFRAKELLGYRLASIHNLRFITNLMTNMRNSIQIGEFKDYKKRFLNEYRPTNESIRIDQKQKWLDIKNENFGK
ncbi:MAG: tRNA guanosine(34) transglycosylase Tgt [Chloroflexi bacterium]|nr:tRNA guanosine(34) transglycosylase Tgt [Chloroflexota bacterium]